MYPLAYPFGKVDRDSYFDDGNDDIPTYSDSSLSTPFVSRLCEWYVARFPGTKCEVISLHRANRVNLATHRLNAAAGGVVEATAYRSYRFAPIDLTARVSPLHADRNWQAARHPKPPLEKPLLRPRVRSTDRSRTTHCYEIPSATTDYRSLLFLDLFIDLFIYLSAYHSHSRSINSYFSRTNEITASLVSIDECPRSTKRRKMRRPLIDRNFLQVYI